MTNEIYSNQEFQKLKDDINKEILRRGTFRWWDPLTTPEVGHDKSSPLIIPYVEGELMEVDENTYTINNPSIESIEPTRNIKYPGHGVNPGGSTTEVTSARKFDAKELRNFIVGLSKIEDINLFYGRDEVWGTIYRDPENIENVLKAAQASQRNNYLHLTDDDSVRKDPNGGLMQAPEDGYLIPDVDVEFPMVNGLYVMPSGETDGEEVYINEGLGPENFFDDHGAPVGVGNYHPLNPKTSPSINRSQYNEGNYRNEDRDAEYGNIRSSSYGVNPRNPNEGNSFNPVPVMGGVVTSCRISCTGLCSLTCDSTCSESCSTTCWGRCGEACTSTCGNVCTGCNSLCYTSCMTRCENNNGYACLEAGAKAVRITTTGGSDNNGVYASNNVEVDTYTCQSCSYTCQFHANKRTECWDSACMGQCFTTCSTYCSTSCLGGCIDNASENKGDYKSGIGRGCSSNCTINCIGTCEGVCEGQCTQSCFHACMTLCEDNCEWKCASHCGSGCSDQCSNECTGDAYSITTCGDCGAGCTSACQHDCNSNCLGSACRSVCGSEGIVSCTANCRMNCTGESCTSKCSDHCSSACTTCVNNCGMQCGACTSECSTSCGAECNITCSEECKHSCSLNCTTSCVDECGGCSGLCYSCVGKCIGVCSMKCDQSCTSCANQCGWWCDSTCGRGCHSSCTDLCIGSCSGSCITTVMSETNSTLAGAEQLPTSEGYQYPDQQNRFEEQDSFLVLRGEIDPPVLVPPEPTEWIVVVDNDENVYIKNFNEDHEYFIFQSTNAYGVYDVNVETGEITINQDMVDEIISGKVPQVDENVSIFIFVVPYKYTDGVVLEDIGFDLQYWCVNREPMYDAKGNIVIIIEKRTFDFD